MAGSFGFEDDKYDVSIAIGELELLPAVRKAPPDWLVIANGFSCREQIAQQTDRQALHLAEVLQLALHDGAVGEAEALPRKAHRPGTERCGSPFHAESEFRLGWRGGRGGPAGASRQKTLILNDLYKNSFRIREASRQAAHLLGQWSLPLSRALPAIRRSDFCSCP